MSSKAAASPIRFRSLYVPPAPGMIANLVSGKPIVACEVKTLKFVARASSRPPPNATEEIQEIVGMGRVESVFSVDRRPRRNSFVLRVC